MNRKHKSRNLPTLTNAHPKPMRLTALILALTLAPVAFLHAQQSPFTTLASLRGNARPLLIFTSTPNDPQLQIQLRILSENAEAAAERNIVPIVIPWNNPAPSGTTTLTPTGAEAARRRFSVPPTDFTAILVGKDGGEKLRSSRPISFTKLRDLIDSMPMRQQEIHNAH